MVSSVQCWVESGWETRWCQTGGVMEVLRMENVHRVKSASVGGWPRRWPLPLGCLQDAPATRTGQL